MAHAIVTGISGNLGTSVARKLRADGYTVSGNYSRSKPHNTEPYNLYQADLTDETSAGAFIQQSINDSGVPELAVLTVGGFQLGNLESTDAAAIEKMIRLNFLTAYNVTRPLFAAMKKEGRGRIFLIGSLAGEKPAGNRYAVAYALSKSLLGELAGILNAEAAELNLVCSLVIPSVIDTPQNHAAMPDADSSSWISPDNIAEIIAWYASPAATLIRQPVIHITGKNL